PTRLSTPLPRRPASTLSPYTTLFRSNESHSERHIQTPHRDSISESKSNGHNDEANGEAVKNDNTRSLPKRDLSLGIVLNACPDIDRKSTRLNSSHVKISYAVFCLKKK